MDDILSRVEKILESKIYGIPYDEKPQSRIEQLLMDLDLGGSTANPGLEARISALENHAILDGNYVKPVSIRKGGEW